MKTIVAIHFTPDGGRYGYGFNYWCPECERYLGNSNDKRLTHAATEREGNFFNRKEVAIACPRAGETYSVPEHIIEVEKL